MDAESRWPHSLLALAAEPKEWKQGLPIGNGVLAAMVCGTAARERLALNHELLWRGKHRSRIAETRPRNLPEIRRLFFQDKPLEAGKLANETFGGAGGISKRPHRVDPYQPLGDLVLEMPFAHATEFRRELDLDAAVAEIRCTADKVAYRRQCIAHSALPLIAVRVARDDGEALRLRVGLGRVQDPECVLEPLGGEKEFGFRARFVEGIRFAALARIVTAGEVRPTGDGAAEVTGPNILILVSAAVNHHDGEAVHACRSQLDCAPVAWDDLLDSHVREHRKLYRRVRLDIGQERQDVTTDQRLAELRQGADDEGLLTLYTNYGRYLLIASSRDGGSPANLQGKWNEQLKPPWECDYHHDINIQMNYWPAEVCGLAECVGPLLDHVERMIAPGRQAARALYDCRGTWMPLTTDLWARTTPEAFGWDCWTGAGPWLAMHFWQRWEYGGELAFLRGRAYPLLKELAVFFEDYLVQDERFGYLVPAPSQSPENTFVGGTKPVSLCVAATMDVELIAWLLRRAIDASDILKTDGEQRRKWKAMLEQLPPPRIGRHGQLQEWLEDYEEAEPGHRHISHLLGLFPGDSITQEASASLTPAARVSLERRLAHEGGHTGWSRAWTVCCWARLREGGQARQHLRKLITDFATDSLLDLHPPRIFQIDGNFGGAAGMLEMLLQSHAGILRLLPALPEQWTAGSFQGLRGRGGFVVDAQWTGGRPTHAVIRSTRGGPCRLALPAGTSSPSIACDGAEVKIAADADASGTRKFSTLPGRTYQLTW